MPSKSREVVRTAAQSHAIERAVALMDSIPDAGSDGSGIIESILDATAQDLVGEQTGTIPIETLFGHNLRIDSVRKIDADPKYVTDETVVPYFVVMEGVDLDTSEAFVTTTSGTTVVLKMAILCRDHALPATVVFTTSETNAGWTVQNCSVVAVSEPVNA